MVVKQRTYTKHGSVQTTSSCTKKDLIYALKINCTRQITLPFLSINPIEKGLPGGMVMRPRDPNGLAGFWKKEKYYFSLARLLIQCLINDTKSKAC